MKNGVLRTVIVDDEPIAQRVLAGDLLEIDGVAVVDHAEQSTQAVEVINRLRPDLVFLDVQMPGLDGFEVARRLSPLPSAIVFVTAFDQYALSVFEAGAADYLLKPIRQERLRLAVDKAWQAVRNPGPAAERLLKTLEATAGGTCAAVRRVVGRKGGEYYLLDVSDILAFRADGELVWIVTRQQRYVASQTLQELTARLDGTRFRRIHRSALVNVDHVRKLSTMSSQRWRVTLSNDLELVVSKRQAHTMREVFQQA